MIIRGEIKWDSGLMIIRSQLRLTHASTTVNEASRLSLVDLNLSSLSGEDKPEANLSAMGGPFTLVDETGRRRTEQDFRGKFMLMYFGYTFCPDICPSELKKMAEALTQLGNNKKF